MPITSPLSLGPINQKEFGAIDYQVMRHAFACQNELGRLCDEVIYQIDLAARLEAAGLGAVRTEVPVKVTHRDFAKTYSLDLVVGTGAIYELKVAAHFVPEHEAQLLNYLLLEGVNHGKLINFRPAQVQSRFVNTSLTPQERHRVTVDTSHWQETGESSRHLRLALMELLEDWGGFLELPLYSEALTHLLGGEDQVMQTVPLTRLGRPLGKQRLPLLASDTSFRLTALPRADTQDYEHHLRSFLAHSPLRTMQWINMFQHEVHLVTLKK